ncbi:MAG TPA: hypothetical protein VE988_15890 [Gemmataceae bacterium]|nr:hypothetical protein [Gemmataceae bacterium]
MSRLLLVVEDRFQIKQRGLLLAPQLDLEACKGLSLTDVPIELRKPDGVVVPTKATIGVLSNPSRPFVIILPGHQSADVPIGTELWLKPDVPPGQTKEFTT